MKLEKEMYIFICGTLFLGLSLAFGGIPEAIVGFSMWWLADKVKSGVF